MLNRMSEQSAKPYLVRAICEWCADNGLTPYLAVKVNAQTRVPLAYIKNGEIVLNISHSATRKLTVDNEWINFTARFSGVSQEVAVPIAAVAGIPMGTVMSRLARGRELLKSSIENRVRRAS